MPVVGRMSGTTTHKTLATLLLGATFLAVPAAAVTPLKFSGAIAGIVSDASGIPQLGATVALFNRQDRLFQKVLTDDRGEFRFPGLLPDTYSVKVTLASFVPASKQIVVQPGIRSILNVNLSSLLSSIQISYPAIDSGSLMTDDWKWMLRGAAATRPVMRFAGQQPTAGSHTAVFSDTRGVVKLSAGEGALITATGSQADLGTAFALATSLFGNNMVEVSGNLGYGSQTGVPSASFRTSFSRNIDGMGVSSPEVSLTMRQLYLPGRLSAALTGNDGALPMLRSMSAGVEDHTRLTDNLSVRYGITMDAVTFLDRLTYISPFARLTYSMGDSGDLEFTYTSGNARPELGSQGGVQDNDLQRDLNTLAIFPRISVRGARPRVQRGEEFELAYTRRAKSRSFTVSAYRERVTNAAVSIVAADGLYSNGDILPDLFSGSSIFNAGNFQNAGVTASVTQNLGDHVSATLMYGSVGALSAGDHRLESNNPDELRAMIRAGRRHAATARITATAPVAGTHLIASYQWTDDRRSVMPGNIYSTQSSRALPGLNVYIRQPLPRFGSMPWRMEATADLRNMLAQGYLPIGMASGQQVLLVETPRSIRGGLSFIF